MRRFLKENWFKGGILVAVTLVGISVFYYYIFFLPQKEKLAIEQKNQEQLVSEQSKKDTQKEEFIKECEVTRNNTAQQYTDFLNTCTKYNSEEYCMSSGVGKMFQGDMTPNFIQLCVQNKQAELIP